MDLALDIHLTATAGDREFQQAARC